VTDLNKPTWLNRIKARVVQDVPSDLAVCEFQCNQACCTSRQRSQCNLIKGEVAVN